MALCGPHVKALARALFLQMSRRDGSRAAAAVQALHGNVRADGIYNNVICPNKVQGVHNFRSL